MSRILGEKSGTACKPELLCRQTWDPRSETGPSLDAELARFQSTVLWACMVTKNSVEGKS